MLGNGENRKIFCKKSGNNVRGTMAPERSLMTWATLCRIPEISLILKAKEAIRVQREKEIIKENIRNTIKSKKRTRLTSPIIMMENIRNRSYIIMSRT